MAFLARNRQGGGAGCGADGVFELLPTILPASGPQDRKNEGEFFTGANDSTGGEQAAAAGGQASWATSKSEAMVRRAWDTFAVAVFQRNDSCTILWISSIIKLHW